MSNPLDPALMSPHERVGEVAEILAAGLLRLRRQQESGPAFAEKNSLDFPTQRSMHATVRKRRRVAR